MPVSTFARDTPFQGAEQGAQEHGPQCSGDWYALRVKPRHEKRVAEVLRSLGYEEFLPLYQARRRWSDRYKTVSLPLFSCYTFCRLGSGAPTLAVRIPGVAGIVGVGKMPKPIENSEIEAIRSIVRSGLPAAPWPQPREGGRVRVVGGPLRGLEGVLRSVKGADRLVVAISLLQRSVAVEIKREWVMVLSSTVRTKPEFYQGRLRGRIAGYPGSVVCNQ